MLLWDLCNCKRIVIFMTTACFHGYYSFLQILYNLNPTANAILPVTTMLPMTIPPEQQVIYWWEYSLTEQVHIPYLSSNLRNFNGAYLHSFKYILNYYLNLHQEEYSKIFTSTCNTSFFSLWISNEMKEMFKKYPPSRNLNHCYSSISGQGEVYLIDNQ